MTEIVLRNNYFEFNDKVKQETSGTAIGTKCAPTYMDKFKNEVLIFYSNFIWTHGEKELHKFMEGLNDNLASSLHTFNKNCVHFLDLDIQLQGRSLQQIYISSLQIDTSINTLCHPTQIISSTSLYIVKDIE